MAGFSPPSLPPGGQLHVLVVHVAWIYSECDVDILPKLQFIVKGILTTNNAVHKGELARASIDAYRACDSCMDINGFYLATVISLSLRLCVRASSFLSLSRHQMLCMIIAPHSVCSPYKSYLSASWGIESVSNYWRCWVKTISDYILPGLEILSTAAASLDASYQTMVSTMMKGGASHLGKAYAVIDMQNRLLGSKQEQDAKDESLSLSPYRYLSRGAR